MRVNQQSRTTTAEPAKPAEPTSSPAVEKRGAVSATSDGSPEVTVERSARTSATQAAPSTAPRDVVTRFYAAFVRQDTAAMEKLYSPDVKFKDAIFSYNDREGTMHMWKKILADPTSKFVFTLDRVEGNQVHGHWDADYTLGGRKVHNEITTTMQVENGKITRHQDDFAWQKWAPQALPLGHLATLPGFKQLVQMAMRAFINS